MKKRDQFLLEEAYSKVLGEDFNSERRLNAFSQNLKGRGFNLIYKHPTGNGEINAFYKAKTDNHRMSIGDKVHNTITQGMGGVSMVSSEFIFIEVDASKNFVDGYVLTVDAGAGSKIVKFLDNDERGPSNLKELLDNIYSIDTQIHSDAAHPLKSYEDVFAQIGRRDQRYAGV
jgi:hypothetical protein